MHNCSVDYICRFFCCLHCLLHSRAQSMLPPVGSYLLPQRPWALHYKRSPGHASLLPLGVSRLRPSPQRHRLTPVAGIKKEPAYNKYRSRQDVEREYYREWERTTAIMEGIDPNRKATVWSCLAALPIMFKFYGIPGPLRFLIFYFRQLVLDVVLRKLQKVLVLQQYKLEAALGGRAAEQPGLRRRLTLLRWHNRVPLLEDLKHWVSLLQGKVYMPQLLPPAEGAYGPNYMPPGTVEVLPAEGTGA